MTVVRALAAAALLATILVGGLPTTPRLAAKSPDAAPPLPAPSGSVVNVSTVSALQAAVGSLTSNRTIVIAPGTYQLTSTLWVNGTFANVTIRGATNDPDDVVLVGKGMGIADAAVPFGIWSGGNVTGLTIANLTIRDIYQHPIMFNAGTESPRVYNVRLVNAGEQFLKANPDGAGGGVDNGLVEYSTFEYTNTAPGDYTNAVDVHRGRDWIIRHNLFRRIRAPQGQLAGPAILMWNGSSGTIAEGNTFIDCHRDIAFGLVQRTPDDHSGGIIRNNVIVRHAGMGGDVAIGVFDSPGTVVVHNTVLLNGQYPNAIEYRFANTSGVRIVNNLADARAQARDGASASLQGNVWTADSSWFVNPTAGDLHLQSTASLAIDRGVVTADATDDWDGEARAGAPDVGADERVSGAPPTPPPPSPPPPPPTPSPPPDSGQAPPSPSPPAPPPSDPTEPAPPGAGGPPTLASPEAGDSLRRRSTPATRSGRSAGRRSPPGSMSGEGTVRRLEVAVGVETWAIESDGRLFEIAGGGLDVVYQVDGLRVVFEAEARAPGKRRSGLTGARPIELITLSPR